MKKFRVTWYRTQYGYVDIEAKTKKEARELVFNGDYDSDKEVAKGGDTEVHDVVSLD
jgi:hypothetical protein